MLGSITVIVLAMMGVWAITRFYLEGPDLSRYDEGSAPAVSGAREPSAEHDEILTMQHELSASAAPWTGRSRLQAMRRMMDTMGDEADLSGITIGPVSTAGVAGEWVLPPDRDPGRRLLYVHGGAFSMGSPRSHRGITTRLARISRAAVLAVDYRLRPEHRRLDGFSDCQTAYRWILAEGPEGPDSPETLFLVGDSAGGNLVLALIVWARDAGLRAADAVVALSPPTDATFSSPSLLGNAATDPVVGPLLGRVARLPRGVVVWLSWLINRVRPCDPRVSPIHADLSNLPATLLQASEAEVLVDDARRYANKARAAGSEVTLETWRHMLHVWHVFEHRLPEAQEAFRHIERFLDLHVAQGRCGAAEQRS